MNDAKPNTCIDVATFDGVVCKLYQVWPAFGGGYIVTGSKNGHTERTLHDDITGARKAFNERAELVNMALDAQAYAAEYADARDTTAGLLQF